MAKVNVKFLESLSDKELKIISLEKGKNKTATPRAKAAQKILYDRTNPFNEDRDRIILPNSTMSKTTKKYTEDPSFGEHDDWY